MMAKLEDLTPSAAVRGILPDALVSVVTVQWFGTEALELTYKDASGRVNNTLLYRSDEPRIAIAEQGRPWSFDGDGRLFRLVSEAHRIRLAHLFDPVLAVHTSLVEPLPHQNNSSKDFARYLYLPRLQTSEVLLEAIRDGCALITWEGESFAYADGYDEAADRYRGLRGGQQMLVSGDAGLLVRPDVARRQMDVEQATPTKTPAPRTDDDGSSTGHPGVGVLKAAKATRYHASVKLDPARAGADASRVGEEVIAHLIGLVGSDVSVTLEIEAEVSNGFPEKVVRTVTENGRTLKFTQQGFETE